MAITMAPRVVMSVPRTASDMVFPLSNNVNSGFRRFDFRSFLEVVVTDSLASVSLRESALSLLFVVRAL